MHPNDTYQTRRADRMLGVGENRYFLGKCRSNPTTTRERDKPIKNVKYGNKYNNKHPPIHQSPSETHYSRESVLNLFKFYSNSKKSSGPRYEMQNTDADELYSDICRETHSCLSAVCGERATLRNLCRKERVFRIFIQRVADKHLGYIQR